MNLELMLHEPSGDVFTDHDRLSRHDSLLCPSSSLGSAIIDEGVDPLRMLAGDGAPEEVSVSSEVAIPLIREALTDSWQPDCMRIGLPHREFGPGWNIVLSWGIYLALDDLLLREQLLHESQGAVPLSWQKDTL